MPVGVWRTDLGGLAALRCGPEVAPAVLLLPGYAASKEDFLPILPALAAAGFAVTALDLRGQHESPGPDEIAAYSLEAFADDVHRVIDALGAGPAHLVGHSFGGLVARAAVIADPGRMRSLTLLSSGPAGIVGRRQAALRTIRLVLERGGSAAVWAALHAVERPRPAPTADFLRQRFFAHNQACLVAIAQHLLDTPDRVAELAAVARGAGLPVLVTHGDGDDGWPAAVQADMARRLAARYEVLPGARHDPAADAPDALVAALVGFWRMPGVPARRAASAVAEASSGASSGVA
ncbi:alpha/beta fold hydrolase [Candidatus Frankia alpina]|uniref:alpha/beta fold hydrolase n=1 Tax=Candidatus Frankia alpina TaxID=2699483 RepID=UPI001F1B87D1|nr:alpha/beta hydrolase [Candidatus Frankia alpina]